MSKRKRNKAPNRNLRIASTALFLLIVLWFIISIVNNRNPLSVLQGGLSKISNDESSQLLEQIAQKDSLIAELKSKLANYEGANINRRALVIIDSETLNMRSGPSLSSNIITKIPANSEVQLLYYDVNTFYIDAEAGKWARIKYGGNDGWVWGNYLREI